jgi:cold shock CspA family protein
LQTAVKKWFRDKDYGLLDNGDGPEILVRKADLVNCQFLKTGARVEFECHPENKGLLARKVKLLKHNKKGKKDKKGGAKKSPFGVMT